MPFPVANDPDVSPPFRDATAADIVGGPRSAGRGSRRRDGTKHRRGSRRVAARIGRVLIAIGVLIFGFVAYQLWGTGLQTAAAQSRLSDEFQEMVQTLPTRPLPSGVTDTIPSSSLPDIAARTSIGESPATPPPEPAAPLTTEPAAGPVRVEMDLIGRLQIPSIDLDQYVVEGVSPQALTRGPGHFPETPMPGELGNSAIAGHRTTFGAPFGDIHDVRNGDDIIVTVPGAGTYYYVVKSLTVVRPDDYDDIVPTRDPSRATLVLVSCHPEYSTRERIIVIAELDRSRSSIATEPTS
jgi:sortase A